MPRRPWQTDENTSICPGGVNSGRFSTLVSVDWIHLRCCEPGKRTWIKWLFSLDWYQHRGVLVLH